MEIQTTTTFEEYKRVLEAIRKPPERSGRNLAIRGLVTFVFALAIVIGIQSSLREVTILTIVILLALLCVPWIWTRLRGPLGLKRIYDAQERQLNGQIMDITQEGISGRWANGNASYRYAWQAFQRVIDLPDAFVRLPNETSFVRVPKRPLIPDQQREVKEWALSGIQKGTVP